MTIPEVIALISGILNFFILVTAAWIKVDVANLKVYMHQTFLTKEQFTESVELNRRSHHHE